MILAGRSYSRYSMPEPPQRTEVPDGNCGGAVMTPAAEDDTQQQLAEIADLCRHALDGVDQALAAAVEGRKAEVVSMQWIATIAFVFLALENSSGHWSWLLGQGAMGVAVLAALCGVGFMQVAIRAGNWQRTMVIAGQRMLLEMGHVPVDGRSDPLRAALEGSLISQNEELPAQARAKDAESRRYSQWGMYAGRTELVCVGAGVVMLIAARFLR